MRFIRLPILQAFRAFAKARVVALFFFVRHTLSLWRGAMLD
jgi:hypothetical protein